MDWWVIGSKQRFVIRIVRAVPMSGNPGTADRPQCCRSRNAFQACGVCVPSGSVLSFFSERSGAFLAPDRGRASACSATSHLSSSKGLTRREAGAQSHGPAVSPPQRPQVAWLPKGMAVKTCPSLGRTVTRALFAPRGTGQTGVADAAPAISLDYLHFRANRLRRLRAKRISTDAPNSRFPFSVAVSVGMHDRTIGYFPLCRQGGCQVRLIIEQ